MILQNLAKAIREQNYYAVVLEFLIVIAGVVIGFQITAWYSERDIHQQEQSYLNRIEADLRQDLARTDVYKERLVLQVNAARRMIAYHEADEPPELIDYYADLIQVLYYEPHRPSYASLDALKSSGDLNIISNPRIIPILLEIENLYVDLLWQDDHVYEDLWHYLYAVYGDIIDYQSTLDAWTGSQEPQDLSLEAFNEAKDNQRIKNGFTLVVFNYTEMLGKLENIQSEINSALNEIGAS